MDEQRRIDGFILSNRRNGLRMGGIEMPHSSAVVLVVEDDPALRRLYQTSLTLEGYAVVAVEDGIDALRFLDGSDAPAAVILDLDLPRLSGRDVRQELLAHAGTSRIPVIVVTGNPNGIDARTVACVLKKPVDMDALLTSIAACLRRVAAQRTASAARQNEYDG